MSAVSSLNLTDLLPDDVRLTVTDFMSDSSRSSKPVTAGTVSLPTSLQLEGGSASFPFTLALKFNMEKHYWPEEAFENF